MTNRNHVNIVLKGNNAIRRWRASHPRQQFDLRRVDFTHANIDGVDLRGANLELADFRWADLRGANLSRANLHRADFHKAVLIQADLQCADLTFANLDDADLSGSLLDRAIFGRTTFNHSTLREASGLVSCVHRHPSELDPETIKRSPGLPIEFLRGCGVFAPYQAIVYRVVIGSPSDVKTERRVVRETINRWNELYSADLGVILRPVMWERHATPVLGVGDHPQRIISRQLIDYGDILVCVFWSRLGTPTPDAESGTLDEIERFRHSGRPVMVYFSNRKLPQTLDTRQWRLLRRFRRRIQREGIVGDYSSPADLAKKLEQHLIDTVRHLRGLPSRLAGKLP